MPGVAPQGWEVSRQGLRNVTLGDAFDEVLSIVWPKRVLIKRFATRNDLAISFDAFAYVTKRSIPVLTIDAKIVRKIAWFDADLGIDMAIL